MTKTTPVHDTENHPPTVYCSIQTLVNKDLIDISSQPNSNVAAKRPALSKSVTPPPASLSSSVQAQPARKKFIPPRTTNTPIAIPQTNSVSRASWQTLDDEEQKDEAECVTTEISSPSTEMTTTLTSPPPAQTRPRLPTFKRPLSAVSRPTATVSNESAPRHSPSTHEFAVEVPTAYMSAVRSRTLRRTYPNAAHYASTMAAAIAEELQLGLCEIMATAEKLCIDTAQGKATSVRSQMTAQHGRVPVARIQENLLKHLRFVVHPTQTQYSIVSTYG